jgi:hypothetical protein
MTVTHVLARVLPMSPVCTEAMPDPEFEVVAGELLVVPPLVRNTGSGIASHRGWRCSHR